MAELDAGLGVADRMDEIDQPPPARLLLVVPQAEAAGRDARVRRDAGHLGEHEPGAAHRAGAEMR